MTRQPQVIIVGGGFAGLAAARRLTLDQGNMATIGRHNAIADFGFLKVSGYLPPG